MLRLLILLLCLLSVESAIAGSAVIGADAPQARDNPAREWVEWDGPVSGPAAQPGRSVWFLASDLRNGGVVGVYRGLAEAGRLLGWRLTLLDGQGQRSSLLQFLERAQRERPAAVALGGFDAQEFLPQIQRLHAQGVTVLGWHAGDKPGPLPGLLFTNITTSPLAAAQAAADYIVASSRGPIGVVLFTDSRFAIATAKTRQAVRQLQACQRCKVLAVEDISLAQVQQELPDKVTELYQRHGKAWTHSIGINDLYYDSIGHPLGKLNASVVNISLGDGSLSAMRRIRAGLMQEATIAEPLHLHGWQMADELNRAFAGQLPSLYVTQPHLLVKQTIRDSYLSIGYDPDNGYRRAYAAIWFPLH
ncbi:substrate-binding domain-containing protein [Chromobacterium haemolyticum]|uniref:substrate-binding domain-containing protein n=1 Tax=Chromobacterium haemolyticum TaxID=394935 RepID=UPI0009DAA8DE|nr:substrate-binding domain-containing protein [Chromobacterium haemolyticum]OQS40624.1 hypothetical protein B0T39_11415 [Chromobacterium haemolyticum]